MGTGRDTEQARRPRHSRCDWGPDTSVGNRNDPALGQYLALEGEMKGMEYTRINTLYSQLSVLCGTVAMSKELIDEVHGDQVVSLKWEGKLRRSHSPRIFLARVADRTPVTLKLNYLELS